MMIALQGLWKMTKILGLYTLIAIVIVLIVMAILKQCFGISTKKLVYGFLKSKK
jgi:nucleoside recognition membrane protein YjiH